MADAVELVAPAKVNLRLCILAREESGFHSLETIFCAVSLSDTVRVRRWHTGVHLVVDGTIDVGPPEQNLAVRAAEQFYAELGGPVAVQIELVKRIPSAAGLGGGSSDAAATLRALNALHGDPLPGSTLLQIGSGLGSDVPFFLTGSSCALAWGRGERLLPLPALPRRPVLIVHPGQGISTADAFRKVTRRRSNGYRTPAFAIAEGSLRSWAQVAGLAQNDFESPAFESIPRLADVKQRLTRGGAIVALLAGSGSSMFGVFDDAVTRDTVATSLSELGFAVWSAATLETMPQPQRLDSADRIDLPG
jgi:4-diphosphocytidyl-2-C-methyl-D-erythritol kinase